MNKFINNKFYEVCQSEFGFLVTEYHYRLKNKKSIAGESFVVYQSENVAIKVSFEWRENYLSTFAYKLINGKIPEVFYWKDGKLTENLTDGFNINDLLSAKGLEHETYLISPEIPIDVDNLEHAISLSASHLKQLGSALLEGDFELFHKAEQIVRSRVKQFKRMA